MTEIELRSAFVEAGLSAHATALLQRARPSISITAQRCELNELATGASRFGGVPDLPPGFRWPALGNRAMAFLAQIDLGSLPANDRLPPTGWLVVFYETQEMPWGLDDREQ